MRIPRCILLCSLLCLTFSSCMPGQRLLHVEIETDNKIAFKGIKGVPDSTPVEKMWDVLDEVPFEITADLLATLEKPDSQDVALSGHVIVRIKHVDEELAKAELETITLNKNSSGPYFSLSADEVKRIRSSLDD